MKKIYEIIKRNEEEEIEFKKQIPYNVMCFLGNKNLTFYGNQICLNEDADYISLEEARKALDWIVDQLGGTVKWQK